VPPRARASREARRILDEEKSTACPIDVESIAGRFAHVISHELPDDISGLLIPIDPPQLGKAWAIVYNRSHPPVRQRFTIAHELGHLRLHGYTAPHADRGFQVRFRNAESSTGSVFEEIEANQFAAELLMPEKLVRHEATKLRLDYADKDDRKVGRLAALFKVSKLAASIRLENLQAWL